jgi:hypothetical protein
MQELAVNGMTISICFMYRPHGQVVGGAEGRKPASLWADGYNKEVGKILKDSVVR